MIREIGRYVGALVIQIILGYAIGFIVPFVLEIGNGWEMVFIPLGMATGVFAGGALLFPTRRHYKPFVGSFIFALVGMVVVRLHSIGYIGIFVPMAGALIGYYTTPLAYLKKIALAADRI